jgi:serine protease AprX
MSRMPLFSPNFPQQHHTELLTTPQRVDASLDYSGRGVVMAYVDSGFYMHPDIADRVRVFADATTRRVKEQATIKNSDVTSWHGLMVAAVGSGNGSASDGVYRGIACDSELVLVKVSNLKGQVKEADILRGLEWLVRTHTHFGVRVVNVSVGGDRVNHDPDHALHRSVRELTEAGVTVVISSGNRGDARLVPPASSAEALVVGGYDDHNSLDRSVWTAYHSNYGTAYDGSPKPDIIAPAQWIASPILPETIVAQQARWLGPLLSDATKESLLQVVANGYKDLDMPKPGTRRLNKMLLATLQERIHAHKLIHTNYQHVDGTSVAAPIVSSVIAQMLEANPDLTPEQIRTILKQTAIPLDSIPAEKQGAGAINARGAVEAALQFRANFSYPTE